MCWLAGSMLFSGVPAATASEAASAWIEAPLSKVRLISGGLEKNTWQAGIEISLKGKAHTYWRNPGDGGVPPTFDFSGSKNLKSYKVAFPAPERSGDPGSQIFGYESEVIFPLTIIAEDPEKPVLLNLHINYAACENICMPAEGKMTLELDSRIDGGALKARIADYQAQVPKPLEGPGAPSLKISAVSGNEKQWRVEVMPVPGKDADLFAEGPDGWFFDTKRQPNGTFEIVLAEKPADAGPRLPAVTLTLTTANGAFESLRHLDAGP